jgi:hypothetical protein
MMILHIKIETLLWLLPVVFMLHDFEEIIMMRPWLNKHWPELSARLPAKISARLDLHRSLSTSAFALAVAEEFVVLSVFTLIAIEYQWYNFWAGLTIAFFIHLLVHLAQFLAMRRYVPCIITTVPAILFCIIALYDLNALINLDVKTVIFWTICFTVFIVLNLFFAINTSIKFDKWLNRKYY